MGVGGQKAVGPIAKKAAGQYVPGSRYKRFNGTNAQRANRASINAQLDNIGYASALVFGGGFTQSAGMNSIVLGQAMKREAARTAIAALVNIKV